MLSDIDIVRADATNISAGVSCSVSSYDQVVFKPPGLGAFYPLYMNVWLGIRVANLLCCHDSSGRHHVTSMFALLVKAGMIATSVCEWLRGCVLLNAFIRCRNWRHKSLEHRVQTRTKAGSGHGNVEVSLFQVGCICRLHSQIQSENIGE